MMDASNKTTTSSNALGLRRREVRGDQHQRQRAIVEVGATVDGDGIHPEEMPALGQPLAGWIATQVALQDKIVDAAIKGDADLAFEALVEDPNSPADEESCRRMFDELRALQADKLPF